jgi:Family of unknown function (DUF6662)
MSFTSAIKSIPLSVMIFLFAGFAPGAAQADENLFGYLYGSDTLPKGRSEVYNWLTFRTDKGQGTYRAWDEMVEFEHGFTDRLQGSIYIKGRSHTISGGALEEEPERKLNRGLEFDGVNVSVKYNLLSVYKDIFGLALYLEPSYSRISKVAGERMNQFGLETKVILQKNFFDDQLVTAYNFTIEPEWAEIKATNESKKELELEHTLGLSYRVLPNWFLGLEGRYHSEYPNFKGREFGAYFLGPNIHYGTERWWATFTFLPQISGSPKTPGRESGLHLGEHEKREFRLKLAFNF